MERKQGIFLVIAVVSVVTVILGLETWHLEQAKAFSVDRKLREISGIEYDKRGHLWAINDGGDEPNLYQINERGEIHRTITVENAKNWDWEDMTQNTFGHFFIGDFGNNSKNRQWMTIYKIENPIDIRTPTTTAEIIKFKHPQKESYANDETIFTDAHYDIEAFVYYKRRLYLFTKNRTSPFDGITRLYRIGDHAANYTAEYVDEFVTCTTLKELCWITSAALSPDNKKLVLLDSQRIWLFENWPDDDFFSGDVYQIELGIVTQKEAVTFKDNDNVIFTDEIFNGIGGNAYTINLNNVTKTQVQSAQTKPSDTPATEPLEPGN